MSKNNSILPENDKMEIAKELGVYDKVKSNGWGEVSSKDWGNIVKKALEKQDREENNK